MISSLHAFGIKVNSMKDRTNKFYVYKEARRQVTLEESFAV